MKRILILAMVVPAMMVSCSDDKGSEEGGEKDKGSSYEMPAEVEAIANSFCDCVGGDKENKDLVKECESAVNEDLSMYAKENGIEGDERRTMVQEAGKVMRGCME